MHKALLYILIILLLGWATIIAAAEAVIHII